MLATLPHRPISRRPVRVAAPSATAVDERRVAAARRKIARGFCDLDAVLDAALDRMIDRAGAELSPGRPF